MNELQAHRHGPWSHSHDHPGPHRHLVLPPRSVEPNGRAHDHAYRHRHEHVDGRTLDPSIPRSRAGVRAVAWSLAVLGLTATLRAAVLARSGSVALLADVIHNGGDALTAAPLGIAFVLRSGRGERAAGYVVVGVIVVSAGGAGVEAVQRLLHPAHLT